VEVKLSNKNKSEEKKKLKVRLKVQLNSLMKMGTSTPNIIVEPNDVK